MSHYIVGVILTPEEFDFANACIEERLEPFYENLEVEPYVSKTKEDIKNDFHNFCKEWKDIFDKKGNIAGDAKKPLYFIENEHKGELILEEWINWYYKYYDINEDGDIISTYNINSKWDWYKVGGRWDGFQKGKIKEEHDDDIINNSIYIKDHLKNIEEDFDKNKYFALIDTEGNWYSNADMLYWGITDNEGNVDVWKEKYKSILKSESGNNIIVAVDCHI